MYLFLFYIEKIIFTFFILVMIYSVSLHKDVPITVDKTVQYIDNETDETIIRYTVYDNNNVNDIGYVDLLDTKNGIKVLYIKNQQHEKFRHFGQVADQIEVEHCLKRGIKAPYIQSVAAIGSHVKHYLRGKRFTNEIMNHYFDFLTKNLSKDKRVITGELGCQKMYMPVNLINELKEKIKVEPLLKGLK